MPRDFYINGESLIRIRFGAHITPSRVELGLAADQVRVVPRWAHKDIYVDDFGPDIPVDMMINLMEVNIYMKLIHFDRDVLNKCMGESAGGANFDEDNVDLNGLVGAGTLMRGGANRGDANYHFMGLNISAQSLNKPWRFPASTIVGDMEFPLGTKKSVVGLSWRAIPYFTYVSTQEIRSSGSVVFDRGTDF